ncbi:sensor histidine kinase [Clostridium chrysemydis]|uniref:sensor histidine kinase n=1 Tax=Clostridium chrysemydis TaxID=2665504 RepID=UPI00188466BC|nr:HAMP domain-containing sensor histidine kinase [Clostridium chrysemydis]
MRNNRALKETATIFFYVLVSAAIFYAIATGLKYVVLFFYQYTRINIFNNVMDIVYSYRFVVTIIQGIIYFSILFYLIYIRNKKVYNHLEKLESNEKELQKLINEVSKMQSDNFEEAIEVNDFDGDIKGLSKNINDLVKDLKNITLEEKKAQKTKNDLITNVSHDLRTPLTSIIGYLNLIEEDKYKDEVELRYYTDSAYKKAKKLKLLIDDLFELTKYQNDGIYLNLQTVDFIEMVWQLISDFQFELEDKGLKINADFCEEKVFVKCDPLKLSRAFENIISNSIKYSKSKSTIDIKIFTSKDNLIFSIKNYGEEISEFDLEHIFDRFFRVDKARNSEINGSGLGLCITKSIIDLHNGKISARSNNGVIEFEVILNLK